MRIAAISDVHGNLAALDAALADIAIQGVDLTVNLGDLVSGPLEPAATADRLMPLGLATIRGNHERQLLALPVERMGASDRYAHGQLTDRHRAWLDGLPPTIWVAGDVFLCHGTPDSDVTYFLETVAEEGARPATPEEVATRAGGCTAAAILCGHTHMPRTHRLSGGQLIVNPGSVGLPAFEDNHPHPHRMEAGSPHARYAILDRGLTGWTAELRAVEYDWEVSARLAAAHGRPDWATALRTGRM
ncbi:MAG TPA: metallophosphoesterase family protein [Azospirillaceae bacterium]|nr:metallophosphoesterase family protein [Azospirillaceae bacterium]